MKSKKLTFFVLTLVSITAFANRTLVIKNKVQLDPKEYDGPTKWSGIGSLGKFIPTKIKGSLVGIFLTPVETKNDALGSEYKVDAGVKIPIVTTKDWAHDISNDKMEIKIDLALKKVREKTYHGRSVGEFDLVDENKTFNYTIPAGKDGETICLEVSWAGVQACAAEAGKK